MVSVVRDLSESSLRDAFQLTLFDTAKQTPIRRSLLTALKARVALLWRWWKVLGAEATVAHIHTCSGLSYFLDGGLVLLASIRRVPVVLHVHGGRFDEFLDGLDPVRRSLARGIARMAARVIVLSEEWRKRLNSRLPGTRLQVIENGVPSVGVLTRGDTDETPMLLFVGAICRAKGVEDLVRAFAKVKTCGRLVLVGPEAEAGFVGHIQAIASGLGIADRIALPGPATHAEVQSWLARASVFVLPSYVEGMPLVLLEAMSAGLPVVATPVGAVPAVVDPDRSGLLVGAGDVDALAAAIGRLLSDKRLRESFGRSGYAIWSERFSIDRAAREVSGLYAELLSPRGAR